MSELTKLIKRLVKPMIPKQVIRGRVISVNKENDTCDIEPLRGGADYLDVRLKAVIANTDNKIVVYPAVGSIVHLGIIDNNKADTYVTQITEFESVLITNKTAFKLSLNNEGKVELDAQEIIFNGGKHKGLIKEPELVNQLNKNNKILASILGVLNGTQIIEPGNGSPSALQIALKSSLTGKPIGDFTNISNEKIKH